MRPKREASGAPGGLCPRRARSCSKRCAPAAELALHPEVGRVYRDAKGLGLFGASNHAAIVVGEHDDRTALEGEVKNALTTYVEILAVDKGDGRVHSGTGVRSKRGPLSVSDTLNIK